MYNFGMSPWRSRNRRFDGLRQAILSWLFPVAGTVGLLIAMIVAIVTALKR